MEQVVKIAGAVFVGLFVVFWTVLSWQVLFLDPASGDKAPLEVGSLMVVVAGFLATTVGAQTATWMNAASTAPSGTAGGGAAPNRHLGEGRVSSQQAQRGASLAYPERTEFAGFAFVDRDRVDHHAAARTQPYFNGEATPTAWPAGEEGTRRALAIRLRQDTGHTDQGACFAGLWWTHDGTLHKRFVDLVSGAALGGAWVIRVPCERGWAAFVERRLGLSENVVSRAEPNRALTYSL